MGEQNKDRWQWINLSIFHSETYFAVRKLFNDKNLPNFVIYENACMINSGQDPKVGGFQSISLSISLL